MADFSDSPENRVGAPPGKLFYLGEKDEQTIVITSFDFEKSELKKYSHDQADEVIELIKTGRKVWIHVVGLHNIELVDRIGSAAGFSPMILEDVLNAEHTPKFDFDDQVAIFITKSLQEIHETPELDYEEDHFTVVFNEKIVMSFQESDHQVIDPIYHRISISNSRMRQRGTDYLAYALIDTVADSHLEHVRKMRDDIEDLEESFNENPDIDIQNRIHGLRGAISDLRKAVWPFRDAVAKMVSIGYRGIDKKTEPYIRDTLDHLNTCSTILDSNREMLTNMRDWQLASLSTKMNEVMRVLTVIATIFIPLTFIAGVYGMNFKHMPELEWPWAYPTLWILMIIMAGGMLLFFRHKKWF